MNVQESADLPNGYLDKVDHSVGALSHSLYGLAQKGPSLSGKICSLFATPVFDFLSTAQDSGGAILFLKFAA